METQFHNNYELMTKAATRLVREMIAQGKSDDEVTATLAQFNFEPEFARIVIEGKSRKVATQVVNAGSTLGKLKRIFSFLLI